MLFSLNSCVGASFATTQDDMYIETDVDIVQSTVDFNVVFRYGTPYYYNGSILYYLYNGIYYYPYFYDNYWYLRAYRRPFPYTNYRPYFRPHRYDYRFDRGYVHPRGWYRYSPNHYNHTPNRPIPNNRITPNRPSPGSRQSIPNRGTIQRPNTTQPRINPGMNRGGSSVRPSTPSRGGFNSGRSRSGGYRGGSYNGSRGGGRR